jgi:hypothetical protein
VLHWPTAHDDDPSEQVTQDFPQSVAEAHVEPNWQQERHAGLTQLPLSEHQAKLGSHTPARAGG